MLPRFGAEVENAENDRPPVTTGLKTLIVHYFCFLSLGRISITLFLDVAVSRCSSMVWLARKLS